MYKSFVACTAVAIAIALAPRAAVAGPFADDMARCLVNSTSDADRSDLVRWIYSAMSEHPDLAAMAKISDQERSVLTARTSKLFSRLLFDSCRTQLIQAVKNEGPQTIQYAFEVLGQVAMRGIMTDSHVSQSLQALGKSLDQAKLQALVAEAGQR